MIERYRRCKIYSAILISCFRNYSEAQKVFFRVHHKTFRSKTPSSFAYVKHINQDNAKMKQIRGCNAITAPQYISSIDAEMRCDAVPLREFFQFAIVLYCSLSMQLIMAFTLKRFVLDFRDTKINFCALL